MLAFACGGGPPEEATVDEPPAPAREPDVYTVRGEITELPDDAAGAVYIRHEAIPDFKTIGGTVQGMDAMTMPFELDPGVALESLNVGDKVEFALRIEWEPEIRQTITAVTVLPEDTVLELGEAETHSEP